MSGLSSLAHAATEHSEELNTRNADPQIDVFSAFVLELYFTNAVNLTCSS